MDIKICNKESYVIEIMKCLKKAIDEFYYNDSYLIEIEPSLVSQELYDKFDDKKEKKKYVGERAAEFRIAHYLQNIIIRCPELKGFVVDCEYNRNGFMEKKVGSKAAFPDIIVHKRGTNDFNLLVVELKIYWNKNNNDDIKKLKYLTSSRHPYKYGVAASIVLGRTRKDCKIVEVKNGEINDNIK